MWSKVFFGAIPEIAENPQLPVCQGVPAFRACAVERTLPRSQTRRDTNFAIPGYSLSYHDTTARGKNKVFSVCGHLCGQNRFYAVFCNRGKSRKRRCYKALRRFVLPCPGYRHGTPKPRALPSELHPDNGDIIPDGAQKSKGKIPRAAAALFCRLHLESALFCVILYRNFRFSAALCAAQHTDGGIYGTQKL